jgi:hypothetical protein
MRDRLRQSLAAGALCALCILAAAEAGADDPDATARLASEPVFGTAVAESVLASQRGGADLSVNENNATATVQGNVARNLATGNNTITENSFSNVTGIPMVVQNSGNNVVIQNSTILNLQMK